MSFSIKTNASSKGNIREKRVFRTMELFINYNGEISDSILAEKLVKEGIKTSRSTVERDLTETLIKIFKEDNEHKIANQKLLQSDIIGNGLTDTQNNIVAFIKKKRKDNKRKGQIKGGSSNRKQS